eukprot:760894-Hanusia_phi.AAC.5
MKQQLGIAPRPVGHERFLSSPMRMLPARIARVRRPPLLWQPPVARLYVGVVEEVGKRDDGGKREEATKRPRLYTQQGPAKLFPRVLVRG